MNRPARVGLVSLGCGKNQVDSEVMLGLLDQAGFALVSDPRAAEIIIVNTCGFVQPAQEEAIDKILEMSLLKAQGSCQILVAAGCLAQRHGAELMREIPELDAVVGTGHVSRIAQVVAEVLDRRTRITSVGRPGGGMPGALPRFLASDAPWAYLKIGEGCDNNCTYCVIPSLRGPVQSRALEDIAEEARALTDLGVQELVLVSQDTTAYGKDIYGRPMLVELLELLDNLPRAPWLRLMYCHPCGVDSRLLHAFRVLPRLLPYVDIPFQHASDRLLRAMGRQYDGARIRSLLQDLRQHIPSVVVRSTFLVGFPGETREDVEELCAFLRQHPLERAGIFAYSREEGTPAAGMEGQVSAAEAQRRQEQVSRLQGQLAWQRERHQLGRVLEVLVQDYDRERNLWVGRSYREAPDVDQPIYFSGPPDIYRCRVPVIVQNLGPEGARGVMQS